MKYFIITYGCQMNKSDSERIAAILDKAGYSSTSKIKEAGLIVVNMCSVRQSAVDRVYGLVPQLKKLKEKNPKLKTILTGCILKEDRKKFEKMFDFLLDKKDLANWPEIIKQPSCYLSKKENLNKKEYLEIKPKYENTFSVSIPISDGCNNFCTYCAVPLTRGRLICREHKKIIQEATEAIRNEAREICLLGQNVNDYHCPVCPSIDFGELLKKINEIDGYFWIRFITPNPADFSEKLIETIAKCEKVTPYLNLPLQSGDDEILKRMNRRYTVNQYLNLVKKIRSAFKKYRKGLEREVALSTDIIVGFPGETKKQFENTKKLMEKIRFDMAYIAQYSPRPETLAAKMKDNISKEEKREREKILTEVLKKTALEKNKKFVGKEIEVLVEKSKDSFLIGKSRHYKTVKFPGPKDLIGKFVKVKITEAIPWGLKGKIRRYE